MVHHRALHVDLVRARRRVTLRLLALFCDDLLADVGHHWIGLVVLSLISFDGRLALLFRFDDCLIIFLVFNSKLILLIVCFFHWLAVLLLRLSFLR